MTRRRHSHHPRGKKRARPERAAPGAPPGTLAPQPDASASKIMVRRFGADVFEEKPLAHIEELASLRDPSSCLWVDVTGLADAGAIAAMGGALQLHDLSLEDALDPAQRGKVEHCVSRSASRSTAMGASPTTSMTPSKRVRAGKRSSRRSR